MDEKDSTAACAACGGTGFVLVDRDGQALARLCACRSRPAGPLPPEQALDRARVPRRFWNCDFEHFFDHSMALAGAKTMAARYAEEYPLEDQGLLLMGSPGVGKTHLAVAILRRVTTEKGVTGLFCDAQDLLRRLQATFERSGPSEDEVLEPVLAADLLVLDDLGGRLPTPWVEDTLLHIVTTRYNERRPMIVTTNYFDTLPEGSGVRVVAPSPAAAQGKKDAEARVPTLSDRIGPRMRSRLYEMCRPVIIVADDFRVRVKHEGHQWPSQRLGRPEGDA